MDASLRVRIPLHADSLTRALASAGVGLRALAAHRQPAQMPDTAITLDGLQPFEVQSDFTAQIAFDDVLAFLNRVSYLRQLLFIEILRAKGRVDVGLLQDLLRIDREYLLRADVA